MSVCGGGVLWVRAKIPSSEPSSRTARQIRLNFTLFIICKCELVKAVLVTSDFYCMNKNYWDVSQIIFFYVP